MKQLCRFQGRRKLTSKGTTNEQDRYCPAAEVLTVVHGVCFTLYVYVHSQAANLCSL